MPRRDFLGASAGRASRGRDLVRAIDPSFVITHRCALDEAPEMDRLFNDKQDECVEVVIRP